MANIRIKDLSTTAATTASDDFFGVDGATNGTRKLSAYSPTFGGNLTVSGGTANVTSATEADLYVSKTGTAALSAYFYNQGTGSGGFGLYDGTAPRSVWEYSSAANDFKIKTATLSASGNLTVSGTGTSSVAGNWLIGTTTDAGARLQVQSAVSKATAGQTNIATFGSNDVSNLVLVVAQNGNATAANRTLSVFGYENGGGGGRSIVMQEYGGNVLIGGTTDSANGNLQLKDTTGSSSKGIGFGTDVSLYRGAAKTLNLAMGAATFWWDDGGSGTGGARFFSGAALTITSNGANSLYLQTGGTTALTLDSSQRCILAGALRLNNAYTAGAPTATGYVTLQDSAGNTYKVLVGT